GEPIDSVTQRLEMGLSLARNTRSPIDQCPEYVEEQRLHAILCVSRYALRPGFALGHDFRTGEETCRHRRCRTAKQSAPRSSWHHPGVLRSTIHDTSSVAKKGYVRDWHFSDVPARPPYVRYRGHFRRLMLAASIQDFPHRNVHFAG